MSKKYLIVSILSLILTFSFISSALAMDNNAVEPRCEGITIEKWFLNFNILSCDKSPNFCKNFGFDWTSNGYPGNAGNPSCCGDDAEENYRECDQYNGGWSWDCNSSAACCDDDRDCVKEGQCYQGDRTSNGNYYAYNNLNPGGNDNIASCDYNVWYDCDEDPENCGVNPALNCGEEGYVPSGEANVGEYDHIGALGCCGDDANEVYNPDDGKCYRSESSFPETDFCGDNSYDGTEYDDDADKCRDEFGFYFWNVPSGDSDSGCWQGMCCVDDTDEYLVYCSKQPDQGNHSVPGINWSCEGSYACCKPYGGETEGKDDPDVNFSGKCVKDGACYVGDHDTYAGLNPGGVDNVAICDAGIWYDCDYNLSVCSEEYGYRKVKAGESDPYPGEYINLTREEYCGDDADEVYNPDDGKCYRSESSFPETETCGDNSYNGKDYDDNQDSCESKFGSFAWRIMYGNSPSGCWYKVCCGDDSSENAIASYCCADGYNYVNVDSKECLTDYDDICNDNIILSGSPSQEDIDACEERGGTINCGNGWCSCDDCDFCGDNSYDGTEHDDNGQIKNPPYELRWDLSSGDSNSNCWENGMCCGDDSDENWVSDTALTTKCSTSKWNSVEWVTYQAHCCKKEAILADDEGNSYFTTGLFRVKDNGNDQYVYNPDNYWIDCDCGYYKECGSSICGNINGVASGESSSHGEYMQSDIDNDVKGCCGDDADEYYKCNSGTGVCKCCNSNSKVVDGNGNCTEKQKKNNDDSEEYKEEDNQSSRRETNNNNYYPTNSRDLKIFGPSSAYIGESCEFIVFLNNLGDNKVKYSFDWGDNNSQNTNYTNSDDIQIFSHSWKRPGNYSVCVSISNNSRPVCRSIEINSR